jgi:hypothetical protein
MNSSASPASALVVNRRKMLSTSNKENPIHTNTIIQQKMPITYSVSKTNLPFLVGAKDSGIRQSYAGRRSHPRKTLHALSKGTELRIDPQGVCLVFRYLVSKRLLPAWTGQILIEATGGVQMLQLTV